MTAILDVLNNFIRKRVTAKSSECSSALVRGPDFKAIQKDGDALNIWCKNCRMRQLL